MVILGHLLYCFMLFYFLVYTDDDLRTFTLLFYVVLFLRQIKPPDVQEKYMIGEKETTEHGVTLVDAPLLLDEGFGLFGSFTDNVT